MMKSRNDVLGFAERTKKNLQHIEAGVAQNADVHSVTQIANSLLGLIVFPWERHLKRGHMGGVADKKMGDLLKAGWPQWEIGQGHADTLEELIRHLRNATAHGRMSFSSDDRLPENVYVKVEDFEQEKEHVKEKKDHLKGGEHPNWCARIKASDLRDFCLRLIDLIEQTVG